MFGFGIKKELRLVRDPEGLAKALSLQLLALAGWINYLEATPPNLMQEGLFALPDSERMENKEIKWLAESGLETLDLLDVAELGVFVGSIAGVTISIVGDQLNADRSRLLKDFFQKWVERVIYVAGRNQPLVDEDVWNLMDKRRKNYIGLSVALNKTKSGKDMTDAQIDLIWTLIDNCRRASSQQSGPSNMVAVATHASTITVFLRMIALFSREYVKQNV